MQEHITTLPDPEWYTIADKEALVVLAEEVYHKEYVAIDTETTGLSIWKDQPLYWSIAFDERRIAMPINTVVFFRKSFKSPTKKWLLANAKFDMHMLANYGFPLEGIPVDVAVMHSLIFDSDSHSLKDMSRDMIGLAWSDFTDTFVPKQVYDATLVTKKANGKYASHTTPDGATSLVGGMREETIGEMLRRYEKEDLNTLLQYASLDAYATLKLFYMLEETLSTWFTYSLFPHEFKTMHDIYHKSEVPFTRALWNCERNGVLIDKEYLRSLTVPMHTRMKEIAIEAARITQRVDFDISGRKDKQWYCFEKMGMKPLGYTKGGQSGVRSPKMDGDFFEHYAAEDPICKLFVEFSTLQKTESTFIQGILRGLDYHSRIHTRFNQNSARTGRLSSSDPNLHT